MGSSDQEPLEMVLLLGERTSRKAKDMELESLRSMGGSGGSSAKMGGAALLWDAAGEVTVERRMSVAAGECGCSGGEGGIAGGARRWCGYSVGSRG